MTPRLKKRWLAVSLIWGVVLAMSAWNLKLIERVQSRRQDMQSMQMDLHYLKTHQAAIAEVRQQKARLTHAVKSPGLGFLVVENNLKQLSWNFGLQQLRVETDRETQTPDAMPIAILAMGPVPAVIGWMTAVEEAYPYLEITHMQMIYDPDTRSGQLQATFNYRFVISEADRVG